MDEEGEIALMLSHFKGHAMVGLGSREYEIVNLD